MGFDINPQHRKENAVAYSGYSHLISFGAKSIGSQPSSQMYPSPLHLRYSTHVQKVTKESKEISHMDINSRREFNQGNQQAFSFI